MTPWVSSDPIKLVIRSGLLICILRLTYIRCMEGGALSWVWGVCGIVPCSPSDAYVKMAVLWESYIIITKKEN